MTVAQFQKYLRALALAVDAAKPGNDLVAAANALEPFKDQTFEKFAKLLADVSKRYEATGVLPDPTPPKAPTPPKTAKVPKPTANGLRDKIAELQRRLNNREALDRTAVTTEVLKFEKLTQGDLDSVMNELKFPRKIKPKADALIAIVNHILAPHTASERADV